MARIVTVYSANACDWDLRDMSYIRWQKISEALARMGHEVDIATNEPAWQQSREPRAMEQSLRRVCLERLDWSRYDVVKTLFHTGFEVLEQYGGARHPCIVSKLGSVVGAEDMAGIYFYGAVREQLHQTQRKIHLTSRYVTLLSPAAGELWQQVHGAREGMLLVPGGVDRDIPAPGRNPYAPSAEKICVFSGNIYFSHGQPEANRVLVDKLNELGRLLAGTGIRLCFVGHGDSRALDPRYVTQMGSASYAESWDYLHYADVGIVVSAGAFMHNNESSKIYHYLRAGLPVVSEAGFPNDEVVRQAGLGFVVPSGDMAEMAEKIRVAAERAWDREAALHCILKHHTWDCRAEAYRSVVPDTTAGMARRAARWLTLHPLQTLPKRAWARIHPERA